MKAARVSGLARGLLVTGFECAGFAVGIATLLGGCRGLGLRSSKAEGVGVAIFWALFAVGFIWLMVSDSRRKKQSLATFAALAVHRGLALESPNTMTGTTGELRIRYEVSYVGPKGRDSSTPESFQLFVGSVQAANWPAGASVSFFPRPSLAGLALPVLSSQLGLPTAVDPTFDESRITYTGLPVAQLDAAGRRVDPAQQMRLSHLPIDPSLRAWLLHRDWSVSLNAGWVEISGKSGKIVEVLDEGLALSRLVFRSLHGWAECMRQAQPGAA